MKTKEQNETLNTKNQRGISEYEYKPEILEKYGRIFSPTEIGKYSSKLNNVIDSIQNSEGIVIIYSQYIYGGCIPIALALEELGLTRYHGRNFFKTKPTEQVDALTLLSKSNYNSSERKREFIPAKYAMITGDSYISKNNKKESGIEESFEPEKHFVYFDPLKFDDLIEKWLHNEKKRIQIGENARKNVIKNHSWQKRVAKILNDLKK